MKLSSKLFALAKLLKKASLGTMKFRIFDIDWEVDDEEDLEHLPEEIILEVVDDYLDDPVVFEEWFINKISDLTGFLINSLNYEHYDPYKSDPDPFELNPEF